MMKKESLLNRILASLMHFFSLFLTFILPILVYLGTKGKNKYFVEHELFYLNKSDEIDLDKKWTKLLSDIKQLTLTGATPSSKEAQLTIELLMELMNKTTKGHLDLIVEKLPSSESFSFPNPFTEEEEEFLKEAMEIHRRDNFGFERRE